MNAMGGSSVPSFLQPLAALAEFFFAEDATTSHYRSLNGGGCAAEAGEDRVILGVE
jgi:hypothetical protein